MSVIIRLQNLPLTANSLDIRTFFHGLSIPDGGVHIVGGQEGDAFIAFSTDEDARQAMQLNGKQLKESRVSLLLSSRNEMYKVIEQARQAAVGAGSGSGGGGGGGGGPPPYRQQQQHQNSSTAPSSHHHHHHMGGSGNMSPSGSHSHHHLVSSSSGNHFGHGHGHGGHQYQSNSNSAVSSSMSPTPSASNSVANDFLRGMSAKVDNSQSQGSNSGGVSQADLSNNPALLFSTMAAIPSATLGGAQNFLTQQNHNQHNQQQQQHQSYPGLGQVPNSHSQQQHHQGQSSLGNSTALQLPPFGHPNNTTASPSQNSNPAAAAAAAAFANGNPFLIPPPTLPPGLPLNFAGMLPGVGLGAPPPNNNLSANSGLNQNLGLNPQNVMNVLGGPGAGNHGHGHNAQTNNANPMNPFSNPPPRLGAMTNGGIGIGVSSGPKTGSNHTLSGGHHNHGGPRLNNMNNFGAGGGGAPSMLNPFGAGVGIGTGNMRQNNHNNFNHLNNVGGMGHRNPFGGGGMGPRKDGPPPQNRFQLGAIPTGRMDLAQQGGIGGARRENRSRSRSRERARAVGPDLLQNRRRRSRSRERDRTRRVNRRSRSNSRSRSRERGGSKPSRRDSRDKREADRKGRSDSSPEKSSQDSSGSRRNRNTEHEPSPTPTPANTTSEEWPGAKLTGIPSDASFREIKDFIRVEVIGGSDGVVRQYDEGVAYLKLANASDYPRVYRSNGRKLRGSAVSIEGITMEVWTQEYKMMKTRNERDIDREKEEEEKREHKRTEREHGRSERHHHNHNSHSSAAPSSTTSSNTSNRSSRFSNASHQSSCIAIRGLAPTITRNELLSRYLLETPCQDFVLIAAPTPTNRHSVTAFVQLETPQVAQNVIDQLARSPLGTGLVVESCEREDLQKAKLKTSGIIPQGPVSGGGGGGRPGMLVGVGGAQDAKSIFDLELGLDDETTTVIMKGAPPNITDRDVFDFFSDIGLAPMNVRVLYDTDGQCSGQVICEFQDNNKAKRATTKDGMLFGRGQISVSLLPCRNRVGAGGGGGGGTGAAVFGSGMQDQANFMGRGVRPGLLGVGPRGPSRFSNSPSSSPNIFEQALQQQSTGSGPVRPSLEGSGGAGAGAGRGARRQSRFSGGNNNTNGGGTRNNNGNQNGRQEGTEAEADLGLFAKKGCVIGLENVPYKASMDDILQYLEEILKITISPDRIIRRYDDFNKPTGDCRVAFDTAFEAKLACDRLKGTYMWKRLITSAVIE